MHRIPRAPFKWLVTLAMMILLFSYVSAQNWLTDLNEAETEAAAKNCHIILVFQGSDWCAPCIKLDREIWQSDAFKKYAEEHVVLLKADFPRKSANQLPAAQQKKNERLAEQYNKQGYFPLVVILDQTGKVLGTNGYKKTSPGEYIEILDSFQ